MGSRNLPSNQGGQKDSLLLVSFPLGCHPVDLAEGASEVALDQVVLDTVHHSVVVVAAAVPTGFAREDRAAVVAHWVVAHWDEEGPNVVGWAVLDRAGIVGHLAEVADSVVVLVLEEVRLETTEDSALVAGIQAFEADSPAVLVVDILEEDNLVAIQVADIPVRGTLVVPAEGTHLVARDLAGLLLEVLGFQKASTLLKNHRGQVRRNCQMHSLLVPTNLNARKTNFGKTFHRPSQC